MRTSIPLLLAVTTLINLGEARPHEDIAAREDLVLSEDAARVEALALRAPQTDDEDRPRYSTVPLFPGDDDEDEDESGDGSNPGDDDGNDDGEDGHQGDGDGDGVVTLIRTVTDDPVTKIITHSVPDIETETVTKALPTTKTVSVIDMDDDVTTTVYVTQTPEPLPPPPPPPAPEPTTIIVTEEPELPPTIGTSTTLTTTSTSSSLSMSSPTSSLGASSPSSVNTPTWRPSITLPEPTTTPHPTTFVTSTRIASSETADDGQWPVSKSYDNGQWHTIYPPWNATDSTQWRR